MAFLRQSMLYGGMELGMEAQQGKYIYIYGHEIIMY